MGPINETDIVYQVFVDRFKIGKVKDQRPKPTLPWDPDAYLSESLESYTGWCGGNLEGVIEAMEEGYFAELGITALWLNPIFSAASYHGYDTIDYYNVEERYGGNLAFDRLLEAAQIYDIKIMLDLVLNHCSNKHPAFIEAIENGPNSKHFQKFNFQSWAGSGQAEYSGWWGHRSQPQWNHHNLDAKQHLLCAVKKWTEKGVNWRWDVPNELPWDFVIETIALMQKISPYGHKIYNVAEIWSGGDFRWNEAFCGRMNYARFGMPTLGFCAQERIPVLKGGYGRIPRVGAFDYSRAIGSSYYFFGTKRNLQLNVLDTHDTPRMTAMFYDNAEAIRMAVMLQMTMPGIPNIYYGSELQMQGGGDPDNRRPLAPMETGSDMFRYYQTLCHFRNNHPNLQSGDYECVHTSDNVFAFARYGCGKPLIIIMNNNPDHCILDIQTQDRKIFTKTPLIHDIPQESWLRPIFSTNFINQQDVPINEVPVPPRTGIIYEVI